MITHMIKDQISFVVVGENKLVAVNSRRPNTGSLVGWSNIKGANRSCISGPEDFSFNKNVRPARKIDFENLNCNFDQWKNNELEIFLLPKE